MGKPRDTAGILPFYLNETGEFVYILTKEVNRPIDKKFIEEKVGKEAAQLIGDEFTIYLPAKGKQEDGEDIHQTALREAAEEIGYNSTGKDIITKYGTAVKPNGKLLKSHGEFTQTIPGSRGQFKISLVAEQIEPGSFTPKEMILKTERSIPGRIGNQYLADGSAFLTLEELQCSLNPLRRLVAHKDVKANNELSESLEKILQSKEVQIEMIADI